MVMLTRPEKPRSQPEGKLAFTGVKVFSASMFAQRQQLGDTVTAWLAAHPELAIVDMVQTQSSDSAYHCLSISVFYAEPAT